MRGSRENRLSCVPRFDFTVVPANNSLSMPALSKPDIGPQSNPSASAAMIRSPPWRLELRRAVIARPAHAVAETIQAAAGNATLPSLR